MQIYYYSGTGNCLKIARDVANATGGEVIAVARAIGKTTVIEDDCVFVYPVYAYEMPPLMKRFIKSVQIKSEYVAVVASYASSYGGAIGQARGLLKRKGVRLTYAAAVKCVENYIPLFGLPKEERVQELIEGQDRQSETVAAEIAARAERAVEKYFAPSRAVGFLFGVFCGFLSWGHRADKNCTGCGLCERVCPTGAITMKDGKPRFSLKCEQCQGCLNWCPQKAIRAKGYKPTSRRYTNPAVKLTDMNQQSKE